MHYNIKLGICCKVEVEIPKLELLEKHTVWNKQSSIDHKKTAQRLDPSIPSEGGVYFLFYSDKRLLYIGKAANIRQRLNRHTSPRLIPEIANQTKRNPKHIVFVSWILSADAGARDIIETAYLRTHGTAWNIDKIDSKLLYPEAPADEDLLLPEVIKYMKKQQEDIDKAIEESGC